MLRFRHACCSNALRSSLRAWITDSYALSKAVYRVCKSIASMSSRLCTSDPVLSLSQHDSAKRLQQSAPYSTRTRSATHMPEGSMSPLHIHGVCEVCHYSNRLRTDKYSPVCCDLGSPETFIFRYLDTIVRVWDFSLQFGTVVNYRVYTYLSQAVTRGNSKMDKFQVTQAFNVFE